MLGNGWMADVGRKKLMMPTFSVAALILDVAADVNKVRPKNRDNIVPPVAMSPQQHLRFAFVTAYFETAHPNVVSHCWPRIFLIGGGVMECVRLDPVKEKAGTIG